MTRQYKQRSTLNQTSRNKQYMPKTKAKVALVGTMNNCYLFKVTRGSVEIKRKAYQKYRPTIAYTGDTFHIDKADYWHGRSKFVAI